MRRHNPEYCPPRRFVYVVLDNNGGNCSEDFDWWVVGICKSRKDAEKMIKRYSSGSIKCVRLNSIVNLQ